MISVWNLVGALAAAATLIQVIVDLIALRRGRRRDATIDTLAALVRRPDQRKQQGLGHTEGDP